MPQVTHLRRNAVRRTVPAFAAATVALLLSTALVVAPQAHAQGVQYTVLPATSYIRWDSDLELERAFVFGGRLLADFGPLAGLEGHYLTGGGITGRFSQNGLVDSLGAPLADRTIDVTDFGLGIRINFGSAGLAPFLRAGGSVLRFDQGGSEGPRQIALKYGGGIRFNVSRHARGELFLEDLRFRMDRGALAQQPVSPQDPERNTLRSNLTLGAGVGFVIGGSRREDAAQERWSMASIPLEAFAGILDFSGGEFERQRLAGVRGGIDAGNYVGLRAFWMHGVGDGFTTLEAFRSLGGEVQFNLNATPRIAPFLVVGGGTLDFSSDYRDLNGNTQADQVFLTLGGGIGLRLTDKFRLNIAARDMVNVPGSQVADLSQANELRHNWLYTAGLSFSIGRSRRGITVVTPSPQPAAVVDSALVRVQPPVVDSVAAPAQVLVDSAGVLVPMDSAKLAARAAGYHSPNTVVIPIPTEGELYIRYGPPAPRDSMMRVPAIPATGDPALDPRPGLQGSLRDSVLIESIVRRILDERSRTDQIARALPPQDTTLLSLIRAERDAARADRQRLQLRLDSLEAALRTDARDRTAAQIAADAAERQRILQAAADSVARAALLSAEQRAVAAAAADAELRGTVELQQRRYDAVALMEQSIPTVTEVRDSERGMVIVLANDLFATGQELLDERVRTELRAVAGVLALYPESSVLVEGHTDAVGNAAANQRLSEARAASVRNALISHGVSAARITALGYGQTRPVADNATAAGRAMNRRAEVIVLGVERPRVPPAL
jgi:outer membrane protein OmpA-like peptidoglycan-associated protein